jgi:metal-responsive CopG/Arc/MetJ family transcriptional regulator
MTVKQRTVTVSFPRPLLEELDKVRGDVPRSRYLQRLLENKLEVQ